MDLFSINIFILYDANLFGFGLRLRMSSATVQ